MKQRDYCVYRYVLPNTGQVIYIGKTDTLLRQRIEAHAKEDKFAPYLGQWIVEYIELANRVETDIVEKYLINYWKPILNEKDHAEGLTNMSIKLPKWIPYEKYEEKWKEGNAALVTNAIKTAMLDETLFWAAYDAALSGTYEFVVPILHPTGMIPLPETRSSVTKKEVKRCINGYKQVLLPDAVPRLLQSPNLILTNVWLPVAELWNWKKAEYQGFLQLKKYMNFANTLEEFKKNGFQEDWDSEPFILRIEPDENLCAWYAPLFGSLVKGKSYYYAEINCEAYHLIPGILESIANKMLKHLQINDIREPKNLILTDNEQEYAS